MVWKRGKLFSLKKFINHKTDVIPGAASLFILKDSISITEIHKEFPIKLPYGRDFHAAFLETPFQKATIGLMESLVKLTCLSGGI
jgi:hypothetical protein